MNYIDELYHHGILGQRWGVRRFQNPDGSLTQAGRKRYGSDSKSYEKPDLSGMSDKELRDRINRAQLEKQYTSIYNSNNISKGRSKVINSLEVGEAALSVAGTSLEIGKSVSTMSKNGQLTKDLNDVQKITKGTSQLMSVGKKELSKNVDQSIDLSNMTDKELRDGINRAQLEKQYNDIYNQNNISKGQANVKKTLEIGGTVLTVGATALQIALAIKSLTS